MPRDPPKGNNLQHSYYGNNRWRLTAFPAKMFQDFPALSLSLLNGGSSQTFGVCCYHYASDIAKLVAQAQTRMAHTRPHPFSGGRRRAAVITQDLSEAGVILVGKAQEKARVFRTVKRRNQETGRTYPWLVKSTALVNHYHFYVWTKTSVPSSSAG